MRFTDRTTGVSSQRLRFCCEVVAIVASLGQAARDGHGNRLGRPNADRVGRVSEPGRPLRQLSRRRSRGGVGLPTIVASGPRLWQCESSCGVLRLLRWACSSCVALGESSQDGFAASSNRPCRSRWSARPIRSDARAGAAASARVERVPRALGRKAKAPTHPPSSVALPSCSAVGYFAPRLLPCSAGGPRYLFDLRLGTFVDLRCARHG